MQSQAGDTDFLFSFKRVYSLVETLQDSIGIDLSGLLEWLTGCGMSSSTVDVS